MVVRGSHPGGALGVVPHAELQARVDSGSAPLMRWALRPGDVLALHSLSFHGGGGLSAALPERNSLVFRVFGDDAVFRAGMMGLQSGSAALDERERAGLDAARETPLALALAARGLGPPLRDGDHFSRAGVPPGSKHPLLLGPARPGRAATGPQRGVPRPQSARDKASPGGSDAVGGAPAVRQRRRLQRLHAQLMSI